MMRGNVGYVIVGVLGALVGMTEIASRYRDNPVRSLSQPGALLYVLVNAGGSVSALFIIRAFGWDFGFDRGPERDLARGMIAGLGALALFRTRLFIDIPRTSHTRLLTKLPNQLGQVQAVQSKQANPHRVKVERNIGRHSVQSRALVGFPR